MEGWILHDDTMRILDLLILPPNLNISYSEIKKNLKAECKNILLVYNLCRNSCRLLLFNENLKSDFREMEKDKTHHSFLRMYDLDSPCYYIKYTDKLHSMPVHLPKNIKDLYRKNLQIK